MSSPNNLDLLGERHSDVGLRRTAQAMEHALAEPTES